VAWYNFGRKNVEKRSIVTEGENLLRTLIAAGGQTQSNISVTYHNSIGVAAYRRGVEIRSSSIASMSLKLFKGDEPVTDDVALKVLRRPNGFQTEYQFRQFMIACAVGRGNGYAWIKRDGATPVQLIPVNDPDNVEIKVSPNFDIFYQIKETGFPTTPIPATDILHFKGLCFTSKYYGVSPIDAHKERLGIIMAAENAAAKTYKTGSKKFMVKAATAINNEQQKNLKVSLENVMNDDAVSGVMPPGASLEHISLSPVDADYINNANLGVQEIGRILGVPNSFLNIDAGGKTTEDEWQGFLNNTLLPDSVNYEQELSAKLLKESQIGSYYFKHSFNSIMRANSAARSEYFTKAISAGWMSANEAAKLEGLPTVKGGDVRMTLSNLIPIEQMPDWIDSKIEANKNKTVNNPEGNN